MSVVVDQLTKVFGAQKALNEVSFEAPQGQITGFLGPNGAGKSTTMKIATGYISPTNGSVRINGVDVTKEPLQVKRSTGYLPEHNPLYLEMYVKEYLGFVASAYRLKNSGKLVSNMIELCGLELEQKKRIGALSKGYRQRVGLAQTLIHDPEVLILDEPTSGLDPNQLVEIRKVIKEASQNKTVILSTHIMQEVEALCDKVVIINRGQIVADSSIHELKKMNEEQVTYRLVFEEPISLSIFSTAGLEVREVNDRTCLVSHPDDPRTRIMEVITANSLPLVSIVKEEKSLEGVFHQLTNNA